MTTNSFISMTKADVASLVSFHDAGGGKFVPLVGDHYLVRCGAESPMRGELAWFVTHSSETVEKIAAGLRSGRLAPLYPVGSGLVFGSPVIDPEQALGVKTATNAQRDARRAEVKATKAAEKAAKAPASAAAAKPATPAGGDLAALEAAAKLAQQRLSAAKARAAKAAKAEKAAPAAPVVAPAAPAVPKAAEARPATGAVAGLIAYLEGLAPEEAREVIATLTPEVRAKVFAATFG